jgi:hypothetical protein
MEGLGFGSGLRIRWDGWDGDTEKDGVLGLINEGWAIGVLFRL